MNSNNSIPLWQCTGWKTSHLFLKKYLSLTLTPKLLKNQSCLKCTISLNVNILVCFGITIFKRLMKVWPSLAGYLHHNECLDTYYRGGSYLGLLGTFQIWALGMSPLKHIECCPFHIFSETKNKKTMTVKLHFKNIMGNPFFTCN